MLGIRTVPLHALPEDGFVPSVKSCSNLVTSKTKAIVLVTPNNPVRMVHHHQTTLTILILDWGYLLTSPHRVVCKTSKGTKCRVNNRRNISGLHHDGLSTSVVFPFRDSSMALNIHPPLLLLKVVLSAWPSSRGHRSLSSRSYTNQNSP